jgi:hypothetical protein
MYANLSIQSTAQCKGLMIGMKPLKKHIVISDTLAYECVRFKKGGGNYTLTDMYTDDVFGTSNSEDEEKRRKNEIGGCGRSKMWGRMSILLECEYSKTLPWERSNLSSNPTGNLYLITFVLNM